MHTKILRPTCRFKVFKLLFLTFLQRVADKNVSNLVLRHNDVVKATQGSLEVIVPTHLELLNSVKTELITPLIKTSSKEAMTQTVNVRPPSAHQPNLLGRSPSADIESQRLVLTKTGTRSLVL